MRNRGFKSHYNHKLFYGFQYIIYTVVSNRLTSNIQVQILSLVPTEVAKWYTRNTDDVLLNLKVCTLFSVNKYNAKTKIVNMNKDIKQWLKVLFVVLLVFCTIIPNAEIWNMKALGHTDGFHVLISVLDFILEGGLIFYFSKFFLFKKEEKEEKE